MTEQRLTDEQIDAAMLEADWPPSLLAPVIKAKLRQFARAILSADRGEPRYTEGHCENKRQPGGCPLHNLHCEYPKCDRRPVAAAPSTPQPAPELLPPISYATLYAFAERHKISYNALCSAVRSALATPQPAPEQVPVETLLEWAVLDGVVRLSKVMDADLQDALRKFASRFGATPQPAPEWADIIEQRLLTWRQRLMNKSGDHLALDDFMSQESIDDLVDFVCAPLATPQPDTVQVPREPTQDMLYAMAELDGWKRGDREHPMLTRWEDYWNAAIAAAPKESKE